MNGKKRTKNNGKKKKKKYFVPFMNNMIKYGAKPTPKEKFKTEFNN